MTTARRIIIGTILIVLTGCSNNTPTALLPAKVKPSITVDVNLSPLDRWFEAHNVEVMDDTRLILAQMNKIVELADSNDVGATVAACAAAADVIGTMRGDAYRDPDVPADYVGMIDESQYAFEMCADMDFEAAAAAFDRATTHTEALAELATR